MFKQRHNKELCLTRAPKDPQEPRKEGDNHERKICTYQSYHGLHLSLSDHKPKKHAPTKIAEKEAIAHDPTKYLKHAPPGQKTTTHENHIN